MEGNLYDFWKCCNGNMEMYACASKTWQKKKGEKKETDIIIYSVKEKK